ncbi:non-homologous end-joining DNA ligase [Candidatus Solirubrobacter pratensis]|uniref:non-homologous end-joining DNA ligase n=1 Tax=Candidatus Solirubrobacter pratensis TaxID=1298857 RepID=UPI0003F6B773|nr:non-homologous end-joining DNA ligase [Candidatus Solirubrobacter pratensis]
MSSGDADVKLSHPDKVLFPDDGITKADLADYYASVADVMVRHTKDRPMNLWRWNSGIGGQRVVQQEIPKGAPEWVARVEVPRRKGGNVVHAMIDDARTLRWLANQNCITPHVWQSRADRLDRPDRIVFDLDPSEDEAQFEDIRAGALALGDHLRELGLVPFAMTTGSRGIHVVAPLRRTKAADEVRSRAGEIAEEFASGHDTLTTFWRKDKRDGRILVDTARNTYAQTVVAPYAVRALPSAPVATPLEWDELNDPDLHPRRWTVRDVAARVADRGDPWSDIRREARNLPAR